MLESSESDGSYSIPDPDGKTSIPRENGVPDGVPDFPYFQGGTIGDPLSPDENPSPGEISEAGCMRRNQFAPDIAGNEVVDLIALLPEEKARIPLTPQQHCISYTLAKLFQSIDSIESDSFFVWAPRLFPNDYRENSDHGFQVTDGSFLDEMTQNVHNLGDQVLAGSLTNSDVTKIQMEECHFWDDFYPALFTEAQKYGLGGSPIRCEQDRVNLLRALAEKEPGFVKDLFNQLILIEKRGRVIGQPKKNWGMHDVGMEEVLGERAVWVRGLVESGGEMAELAGTFLVKAASAGSMGDKSAFSRLRFPNDAHIDLGQYLTHLSVCPATPAELKAQASGIKQSLDQVSLSMAQASLSAVAIAGEAGSGGGLVSGVDIFLRNAAAYLPVETGRGIQTVRDGKERLKGYEINGQGIVAHGVYYPNNTAIGAEIRDIIEGLGEKGWDTWVGQVAEKIYRYQELKWDDLRTIAAKEFAYVLGIYHLRSTIETGDSRQVIKIIPADPEHSPELDRITFLRKNFDDLTDLLTLLLTVETIKLMTFFADQYQSALQVEQKQFGDGLRSKADKLKKTVQSTFSRAVFRMKEIALEQEESIWRGNPQNLEDYLVQTGINREELEFITSHMRQPWGSYRDNAIRVALYAIYLSREAGLNEVPWLIRELCPTLTEYSGERWENFWQPFWSAYDKFIKERQKEKGEV